MAATRALGPTTIRTKNFDDLWQEVRDGKWHNARALEVGEKMGGIAPMYCSTRARAADPALTFRVIVVKSNASTRVYANETRSIYAAKPGDFETICGTFRNQPVSPVKK